MEWKEGKLSKEKVYAGLGGLVRISAATPIKVLEVIENYPRGPGGLFTVYGIPPYKKDPNAKLVDVPVKANHDVLITTEKGKTYTIVPL